MAAYYKLHNVDNDNLHFKIINQYQLSFKKQVSGLLEYNSICKASIIP